MKKVYILNESSFHRIIWYNLIWNNLFIFRPHYKNKNKTKNKPNPIFVIVSTMDRTESGGIGTDMILNTQQDQL